MRSWTRFPKRHVGLKLTEPRPPSWSPLFGKFQAKLAKAQTHSSGGVPSRDNVLELEQAGDSAKAAAEADAGVSSERRVSRWSPRTSQSA